MKSNSLSSPKSSLLVSDSDGETRAERLRFQDALSQCQSEAASDAMLVVSPEGKVLHCNRRFKEMLGLSEESGNAHQSDAVTRALLNQMNARLAFLLAPSRPEETDRGTAPKEMALKNGRVFEHHSVPLKAAGTFFGRVWFFRDITKRKRAEAKVFNQSLLLDQARDALIIRDLEDNLLYWNQGAERIYGWSAEEVLGKNIRSLYFRGRHSELEQAKRKLLNAGHWEGELRQLTREGEEIVVESHWQLVSSVDGKRSIIAINRDITENKELEAQYLRLQRVEGLGSLAKGIAHDLNNVFTPALLALRTLSMKFRDDESRELLEVLELCCRNGADLVYQLLDFARGTEGERILLQPQHIIKEVVNILNKTMLEPVNVKLRITDDLWPVNGNPTQLTQILLNLGVNARDAMPHGGELTITARNLTIRKVPRAANAPIQPGPFVVIGVSDTGQGIPSDIRDKIFEPFFTTKPDGKGSGIGLSTVRKIVATHGGFIKVSSKIGVGTRFDVYLPVAGSPVAKSKGPPIQDALIEGNGEMILIFDNDAFVRRMIKFALDSNGYRTLAASNRREALSLFQRHRREIRAVLIDMKFGDRRRELIKSLKARAAAVKVIALSALMENEETAELQGVEAVLSKPFSAETLLNSVGEALRPRQR